MSVADTEILKRDAISLKLINCDVLQKSTIQEDSGA